MNKLEYLVDKFNKNPSYLDTGAGKLSALFKCSVKLIKKAKFVVRENNNKNNDVWTEIITVNQPIIKPNNKIITPIYQRTVPGTYVLLPCVHSPFHLRPFVNAFLRFIACDVSNIKGLVIMGDFIDMASLSTHDNGKLPMKGIDLEYEYEQTNILLDEILAALPPNISKDYIYGNHEDRYFRYMRNVDASKLGKALPSPTVGLKLIERGFNVLENWKNDSIKLGRYVDVCHGEFTNVHTAKKHIDTYRTSLIYCHTHRKQIYLEGQTGGWNIGSMADFKSEAFGYATKAMKASWNNAAALCTIDEDQFYHVQPILWMNNRFYIDGRKYQ